MGLWYVCLSAAGLRLRRSYMLSAVARNFQCGQLAIKLHLVAILLEALLVR